LSLGFPITSIQSLLFNRLDLQLFGSFETRQRLISYLLDLSAKASTLGAGPMVFGSPKNRNRGSLSIKEANASAISLFKELSDRWGENSSYLALEANPEVYDCNFITKASEAAELVQAIDSQRLRWNFDFGCTEAGLESSNSVLQNSSVMPSHIHLSEFNLLPLKRNQKYFYKDFIMKLTDLRYQGVVTLEMRKSSNINDLLDSITLMNEITT
jgi:hypothetical protein